MTNSEKYRELYSWALKYTQSDDYSREMRVYFMGYCSGLLQAIKEAESAEILAETLTERENTQ